MEFLNPIQYELNDRPRVFKGGLIDPDRYVTYKDVERCLNRGTYDIEVINPDNGSKMMNLPKSRLIELVDAGCTYVVSGYSLYNEVTNELCRAIENNFKVFTDIHLYGGSDNYNYNSFGVHADWTANFICQIYGKTEWTVFNERCGVRYEYPDLSKGLTAEDLGLTVDLQETLERGDVLYIPYRTYHRATPLGERLSMSIPMWQKDTEIDRNFYEVTRWK